MKSIHHVMMNDFRVDLVVIDDVIHMYIIDEVFVLPYRTNVHEE